MVVCMKQVQISILFNSIKFYSEASVSEFLEILENMFFGTKHIVIYLWDSNIWLNNSMLHVEKELTNILHLTLSDNISNPYSEHVFKISKSSTR